MSLIGSIITHAIFDFVARAAEQGGLMTEDEKVKAIEELRLEIEAVRVDIRRAKIRVSDLCDNERRLMLIYLQTAAAITDEEK
jgi:hypothetical protein